MHRFIGYAPLLGEMIRAEVLRYHNILLLDQRLAFEP
jgi:hypothetical protein